MNELTPQESKIIERANKTEAKQADIEAVRKLFEDHPEVWNQCGNMVKQNILRIFDTKNGFTPAAAISTRRVMSEMQTKLGFDTSPMLEKMVIDAAMLAWLRWQEIEYKCTSIYLGEGIPITRALFWEKRLSSAQGRFLKACESLARIRKLSPTLQINIATENGQQVNIAGDLIRPTPTDHTTMPTGESNESKP
jgi:hypothetical protein